MLDCLIVTNNSKVYTNNQNNINSKYNFENKKNIFNYNMLFIKHVAKFFQLYFLFIFFK